MKLFAITCFFIVAICIAQCAPKKTLTALATTLVPIAESDTLLLEEGDSSYLSATQAKTTFVLLKQPTEADWFNYVFPIITLLLGILIDRIWDWCNDRKRTFKAGKRWTAELRTLDEPIKKQVELINNFLIAHNEDKFGPPYFTILDILRCEVFKSLDKSELLRYIELRRKLGFKEAVTTSNKTLSFINVLSYQFQNLQERFNEYRDNASKYVSAFNGNLQALMGNILDYQLELEKELGNAGLSPGFIRILELTNREITPHLYDGNYELFALEEKFFKPLNEILSDLRGDERTRPIRVSMVECRRSIKAIKMEKKYLAEVFEKIRERYEMSSQQLASVCQDIDGKSQG